MIRGRAALMATLAVIAGPGAAAQPAGANSDYRDGQGGCFYVNQLQGNHALNNQAVIFRVNVSDFYRMDFAQRCEALVYPQPKLILTPVGGIGLICKALDVDVKVGEQGPGSIPEPCIPSSLYKLTPAEVAATPKKNLP